MPSYPLTALAIVLALCQPAFASSTPHAVHQEAAKAVASEAQAQERYQQWTDQRESMAADIRDMKAMDAWLEYQNRKYEKYIQKQKATIAELQRRKEEAKRIRRELEPFLETVVEDLEKAVATDLPFLAEERTQRIRFLHDSLDDYHLNLSEKLRRVFEALLVETEYGRSISNESRELDIDGVPTRVSIFRLGRTALFYQTSDGAEAGIWDREASVWQPLEASYARTLQQARDMADRKRAVELLELPMGASR